MKIKISSKDIRESLDMPAPTLPTYVSPILNLANRFARGTAPKVVGQMTELIQQFGGRTLDEWAKWYQEHHPDAIRAAVRLIRDKLREYRSVMDAITDGIIEEWVKDLVLAKTFVGLRAQEAILKKVAKELNMSYRLADVGEEAKGIDDFIGDTPVSIKPSGYQTQVTYGETFPCLMIFYDKQDDGTVVVEFDESKLTSNSN